MTEKYKQWTILPFPTPIGGHMAAIYRPDVTPAPCTEEWVTPWWNTEAEAIHSAKRKIDVLELSYAVRMPESSNK